MTTYVGRPGLQKWRRGTRQVLVLIMILRAIQRLAARVAAGALLATPVVVTFADTVGSVGTVTGCSMRVCEQLGSTQVLEDRWLYIAGIELVPKDRWLQKLKSLRTLGTSEMCYPYNLPLHVTDPSMLMDVR